MMMFGDGSTALKLNLKFAIQKLKATLTIVATVAMSARDKYPRIVPNKYQQSVPNYAREHRTAGLFSIYTSKRRKGIVAIYSY